MNKPALIIALQEAAEKQGVDLSWLDVDKEFVFEKYRYTITRDGALGMTFLGKWIDCSKEPVLFEMLNNTCGLGFFPRYTEEEAEQARKDMECSLRFVSVKRYLSNEVFLIDSQNKEWGIEEAAYPSLKQCTKERLSVIAGCGE